MGTQIAEVYLTTAASQLTELTLFVIDADQCILKPLIFREPELGKTVWANGIAYRGAVLHSSRAL